MATAKTGHLPGPLKTQFVCCTRATSGVREAQVVIESWRRHYNRVRPHVSLGYRSPAPEVVVPALAVRATREPGGLWPIRGVLAGPVGYSLEPTLSMN